MRAAEKGPDMRASQKCGPDRQADGGGHAFMRILDEAIPAGTQPIIHTAFGKLHAFDHFRLEAMRAQTTRQLQTIM